MKIEILMSAALAAASALPELQSRAYSGKMTVDHGQPKSQVDSTTFSNLQHFSKLMSVAACVQRPNGLNSTSKAFSCADCSGNLDLVKVFSNPGPDAFPASGFLAADHQNKQLVLAFRSHMMAADVISSMQSLSTPLTGFASSSALKSLDTDCNGCKVHQGFLKAYTQMAGQIDEEVQQAMQKYSNYKVFVIGHSLGGAIAQLYAAGLKVQGHKNVVVISDASPMIGNAPLANWIDSTFTVTGNWNSDRDYYRVTRNGDIVVRAPLANNYHQSSGEIYIASEDGLKVQESDVSDCSGQQNSACSWGAWRNALQFEKLLDRHQDYFVKIGGACQKQKAATNQNWYWFIWQWSCGWGWCWW